MAHGLSLLPALETHGDEGGLIEDANQRQAVQYANLVLEAFLKHQYSVKMVTLWGVNDAILWRAKGEPLPFDAKKQPKLAVDAVIAEAKNANR